MFDTIVVILVPLRVKLTSQLGRPVMVSRTVVTTTNRSNAAKYQVEYDDAGRARCVYVQRFSSRTGNRNWRAIWNSDYPLEGKALAAVTEAERRKALT